METGIGLGTMIKGLTGSLVEKKEEEKIEKEKKEAKERQKELDKLQRSATALRGAFDGFKATNDPEVFKGVYKALDPEGPEITGFESKPGETTITYKGHTLKGDPKALDEAIRIIEQNPGETEKIMQELIGLGLVKIEIAEEEETKGKELITVKPDDTVIDETGKVIFKAPSKPDKDKAPKAKVSDYSTYIGNVLKKYQITQTGITADKDGNIKIDLQSFLQGEQSAYQAIRTAATAGDQEATKDLKNLEEAYEKMREILGIGQEVIAPPQPAPATPPINPNAPAGPSWQDYMTGGNQTVTMPMPQR